MLALIGKVIVHNLCSSFSIKLGAVGVGYILTQLQLKAQSIIGELPRQSQAGNEVTLTVDVNQSFQDLIQNVAISLTVGGMGNVKTVVGHILRLCDHHSTTTNHTGFNGLLSVNWDDFLFRRSSCFCRCFRFCAADNAESHYQRQKQRDKFLHCFSSQFNISVCNLSTRVFAFS